MPAFKAGALDHSAKLPMNGVRGRIRTCVGLTGWVATSFLRPLGHPYKKDGFGGRRRTCDIVVNSHALYQLSYTGKFMVQRAGVEPATHGFSGRCSTD